MELDSIDKKLLDIIQTGFPITPRPYAELGARLNITEAEALAKVRAMQERNIIRRLGANFQSAKLGFRSTLCAAKVPDESMDLFVKTVNEYTGVTHNYLRRNAYNIWFTFIGPSWDAVCESLAEITQKTGIEILNLPAKQMYKIRVDFQMDDQAKN